MANPGSACSWIWQQGRNWKLHNSSNCNQLEKPISSRKSAFLFFPDLIASQTMITASSYHTKTCYERHHMGGHALDWENQPDTFKHYKGIKHIQLPDVRDFSPFKTSFFSLPQKTIVSSSARINFSIDEVARILILTQAITARSRGGGTDFWFRSAASAGALYPTEIYLASRSVAGLDDGIYHYSAFDHCLAQIRQGSFVNLEGEADFGVVFFFTAIFFRSSWKYRDRAYRYNLLDTGHVMENHILALKAMNIHYRIHYDFDDREVNLLLGIEDVREVALVLVDIPGLASLSLKTQKNELAPLPSQIAEASRVARVEKDYDLLRQFNESCIEVRPHSAAKISDKLGLRLEPVTGIIENPEDKVLFDYPEVLFQRRSKRNFMGRAISPSALAKISAAMMTEPYPYVAAGMLLGPSEAIPSGLYVFDQESRSIYRAAEGGFNDAMADICLHQMWIAAASIHFVFLSNLDIIDGSAGPRGYRYAMIGAGRMGQRLYLAATALGIGCCGIGAFYDREAAELLGLDDKSRMLYLVAVGSIKNRS
ncbi:MAG: hypothetical protein COX16_12225 [Deltaproteobacteria bacterium CG23_combo_of_CG06-09_8_20_14_all_51_20]|nr:MAG: hypothetical protein COX16_12225 [Deltaproteobacteria bacterium CG23_combo_of_CG06-09_8_20_14_all_51_20]